MAQAMGIPLKTENEECTEKTLQIKSSGFLMDTLFNQPRRFLFWV
jgi:hypothetical protein